MPQQPVNKEYSTFVKGFITEANPLTFPENASIDEENFILNRDGSRQRRLGMDYEEDFELRDTELSRILAIGAGISTHLWLNINENASLSFYIIQIGNNLWFFDSLQESVSSSPKNGGNSITLPGSGFIRWQSDNLGGRIVFCTGEPDVYSLTYDEGTDTVGFITHGLLTRDVWGLDDGLDTDERPVTLSRLHEYNLKNQGWDGDNPDSTTSYYQLFKSDPDGNNQFPSNADLVQLGKLPGVEFPNRFTPLLILRSFMGNTPSPNGHFIIDVFNRGETRSFVETNTGLLNNGGFEGGVWVTSGPFANIGSWGSYAGLVSEPGFPLIPLSTEIPVDKTDSGMRVVASYAERFFYSGSESLLIGGDSKSPLLGHLVFYTQIIDAVDKVGKCYQEADPTSDEQSDLVATDGGFVKIPGMSRCLKMVPYSNSLIIFAENGVWEITGGDEGGFKATDFQILKITDTGPINARSIVEVEDRIYYWSQGGVYLLSRDQISLGVQVQSISESTIQSFFETLGNAASKNATGAYDPVTKQIRWMVSNGDDLYDGTLERFRYNFELVYDVVLEAFYKVQLPNTTLVDPYVADYIVSPGFVSTQVSQDVEINGEQVTINGEEVVISTNIREGDFFKIKYLTMAPVASVGTFDYTFSFYKDANFEDWGTHFLGTGIDAQAFLLTGHETLQDTQRQKQVNYLTTHFLRSETGFETNTEGDLEAINPSSCLIQSQWDFANSATSGKFGPQFQAYRLKRNYLPSGLADTFDYGWEVITTKSKLRGRGRALSLLFQTEPRKDLTIFGWGLLFGVNTNV